MQRSIFSSLIFAGLLLCGPVYAQPDNALPADEGRDLFVTACSQCHNLRTIMAMREGAEGWRHHVYDMVLRGAQLNDAEAETVIAYLAKNFGPNTPQTGTARVVMLPDGPGKDLVETRCAVCHDLERVVATRRQPAGWNSIVATMVKIGAVATPDEARTITAYLTKQFGGD